MKVAVPLRKYILAPLTTTAAASAIDAGIRKKKCMVLVQHNFKWRKEWHNEISLKLLKIQIFYCKELQKEVKMKQKSKKDNF